MKETHRKEQKIEAEKKRYCRETRFCKTLLKLQIKGGEVVCSTHISFWGKNSICGLWNGKLKKLFLVLILNYENEKCSLSTKTRQQTNLWPWYSGYWWRFMFKSLWVQIQLPDIFTFVVIIVLFVGPLTSKSMSQQSCENFFIIIKSTLTLFTFLLQSRVPFRTILSGVSSLLNPGILL